MVLLAREELYKYSDPSRYDDAVRAALKAAFALFAPSPGTADIPEGEPVKGWHPTHRHVKRGSRYRLDGYGEIQTDTPLTDYAKVAIYSAEDGCVWVRPVTEFEDGRFEALASPSPNDGEAKP